MIVTAIFGAFDATLQSQQQAVLKNIINVEKKDGTPFESLLTNENIAYIDYGYHLEQCQLQAANQDIEATKYFLPQHNNHVSLIQGRMPQNDMEILVSQPFYQKYHNQNLTLTYQQKTFSLVIVGVLPQDFLVKMKFIYPILLKIIFQNLSIIMNVLLKPKQHKINPFIKHYHMIILFIMKYKNVSIVINLYFH
ncbi:hypothetical protein NMU03_12140 [Allocoprobacillus halotolerans]|uniref:Uncharacterized protein n=1 Tax=Allocoprobacillus halotolerans TaxID=2944914 RepID=A0ABY5I372_9FIRM|nr:hypothetical protein [Allocoprobacillus halotolerans]UTY38402.1 hypothetical protein NMU03_12140 [Allocoprobacillus halotolerans]